MKKIKIANGDPFEIPEIKTLEEIENDGLYAVEGFDRPIEAVAIMPCCKDILAERYDQMKFFTGADGREYCALETDEFA